MTKDLEMRTLSWIIWVDLKCNHIYSYKREARAVVPEGRTMSPKAGSSSLRSLFLGLKI